MKGNEQHIKLVLHARVLMTMVNKKVPVCITDDFSQVSSRSERHSELAKGKEWAGGSDSLREFSCLSNRGYQAL